MKKEFNSLFYFLCPIFASILFTSIIFCQVSYNVNFSKSSLNVTSSKEEDGEEYERITMEGLDFIDKEVGLPEIPAKVVRLIVPAGQEVNNIVINTKNKQVIKLNKKIKPVQYEIPTSIKYEKRPFVKPDVKTYNSGEPYPNKQVKVLHSGYFDGANHIIELAVYPFQYLPKENIIEFFDNISFTLEMTPGVKKPAIAHNRRIEKQKHVDEVLIDLVDNPQDIPAYQVKHENSGGLQKTSTVPSGTYDYVIVTTSNLSPAFNKFIQWKRKKGVRIYIKLIDDIINEYQSGDLISGIGDNAGKLRQFLYHTWDVNDIKYVLLAGDVNVIPTRHGCGTDNTWDLGTYVGMAKVPADLYFSDFTGDWNVDDDVFIGEETEDDADYYPEIYVGRLLFQIQQEVLDWTDKLIEYEINPFQGSYEKLTRFLWSQADQLQQCALPNYVINRSYALYWNYITSDIISEKYLGTPSYNSYTPDEPSGAQIISELNNGYHFYNIYNHGAPTSAMVRCPGNHDTDSIEIFYGIMSYDASDGWYQAESGNGLDNITSNNKSMIIYSTGCENAQYDAGVRCMADAFTTLGNSGGVAFLGNTRVGMNECSADLHIRFMEICFNNQINNKFHIGEAEALSRSTNSSFKHYLAYSHNLFGDPEMPVWTTTPTQFTSTSITYSSYSVTVNAGISGCTISAKSFDDNYQESSCYSYPNGVSSFTFNTAARPLYITITKENYIPYTAIIGDVISSNTTFYGKLDIFGNLTVQNGVTLTIEPRTSLRFYGNSKLMVNGTLNADGSNSSSPITFDFIAPYVNNNGTIYNGIIFNSTSSGTINYCQIRNAYKGIHENGASINITNTALSNCTDGIYLYSTSPIIQGCNIHNNSNSGINLTNSSPTLFKNYIQNNYYGIYCSSNSQPIVGNRSMQTGNYISSNTYGMNVLNNAIPLIGNSNNGGFNNLLGNNTYNILNSTANTIYAQNNWWGSTNPANFLISGGPVTYSPYRPSLVNIQTPPLSKVNGNLAASLNDEIPMLSELDKAYQLLDSKNFSEAREICLNLVNNYPDYSVSFNALNILKDLYTENELSAKKNIFETLKDNKSRKDLYAIAGVILSDLDKVNKLKHLDDVLNNYKDGPAAELAMFNKFVYYYFELEDVKNALAVSNLLDERFPKSSASIEAHKILGDEEYFKMNVDNQQLLNKEAVEVPKEFMLYDNYPNPFNPATVIKYAIPQNSKVVLEVFNTLGEKVATLVNEEKTTGYYETKFDGSNLASGIYIYRLTANSLESGEQFVKSAKMLMIK